MTRFVLLPLPAILLILATLVLPLLALLWRMVPLLVTMMFLTADDFLQLHVLSPLPVTCR